MGTRGRGKAIRMGILDRLFGRTPRGNASYGPTPPWGTPPSSPPSSPPPPGRSGADDEAIRRYRYLLRTAPPEAIEQAHAEAFAQLTPDQRRQVLEQLSREVPEYERARYDDPASLARMATRAELRSPGLLERVLGPRGYRGGYGGGYAGGYGGGYGGGFGYGGGGIGMGGVLAGSLLASVAGSFIGTAIADEFFDHDQYDAFNQSIGDVGGDAGSGIDFDNSGVDTSGVDDRTAADTGGDPGSGAGYEQAGYDDGGGGSDFGDFGDGGDFGGGGDW
jgi:hypothetical protein